MQSLIVSDAADREWLADALGQVLRLSEGLNAGRLRDLVEWTADHLGIDLAGLPSLADDLIRVGLTTRERDVFRRIVAGRSNKEIGVDLGIREKTVEIHVSNVLRKLGVMNRVEAATKGVALGIRSTPAIDGRREVTQSPAPGYPAG